MKFDTIAENLKNSIYGDQGISPSSADVYIWANMGEYVLDPLRDKMYIDMFVNNALIVDTTEDNTFNSEIDFPSVSYIKDDFEYIYTNKQSLKGTVTTPASKRKTLSLLNVVTPTTEEVIRLLLDVKISTKYNGSNEYKIEVIFPDAESDSDERVKQIKVIPRSLNTTNTRQDQYTSNKSLPQFFDSEETDENTAVDIWVELPSLLGDTYTISATIEEFGLYVEDGNIVSINVIDNNVTTVNNVPSFDSETFEPNYNGESSADFVLIEPAFDVFVMSDEDVNKMMAYLVSIYNYTSDEQATGAEQTAAFREYNTNLKGYPSKIFYQILPNEFKKGIADYQKTPWNSGVKLVKLNY